MNEGAWLAALTMMGTTLVMASRKRVAASLAPRAPSEARCRARRGFTLIELLVTVAIIVLLVALLFPAFNAARRQAYAGNSVANLRQIAAALAMYKDVEGGLPGSYAALKRSHPQIVPVMHHLGDPIPGGFGNYVGECRLNDPRLPVPSTYLSLLNSQLFIPLLEEQGVRYAFFVDLSFADKHTPHGYPREGWRCGGADWAGKAIRAFPDTSVRVGRYGPVKLNGREFWCNLRIFSEEYWPRIPGL
jgi:prepilin-type N-terminal cleavage/methylation domain-containing protein